jgi:uncharacterized protein YhhL (DUF1145 family)
MIRFSTAMVLFGVVALLAWTTLSNERVRGVTLLVLGLFAVRTWAHRRRQVRQQQEENAAELPGGEAVTGGGRL